MLNNIIRFIENTTMIGKSKMGGRFTRWVQFWLVVFAPFALHSGNVYAQELNARITISASGLPDADQQLLQTLQEQLTEFVNQRNWTSHQFQPSERIEFSMMFSITERSVDEFRGTLSVQSRRPVFNTSYQSPVLNHLDRDVVFRYVANQPLQFSENQFLSNITSLVAFYVYLVLGLDFDTFSPLGGSDFFRIAQNIVNQAQNAPEPGWKSFESRRNRYWLAENLMNPALRQVREALHQYHRLGFDRLSESVPTGRGEVLKALEMLSSANRERPGSFIIPVVIAAKSDELIELFAPASPDERNRVFAILNELDPGNTAKYQRLRQ